MKCNFTSEELNVIFHQKKIHYSGIKLCTDIIMDRLNYYQTQNFKYIHQSFQEFSFCPKRCIIVSEKDIYLFGLVHTEQMSNQGALCRMWNIGKMHYVYVARSSCMLL